MRQSLESARVHCMDVTTFPMHFKVGLRKRSSFLMARGGTSLWLRNLLARFVSVYEHLKHMVSMPIITGCWLPMLLLHGQLCQDSLCCPQGRWRSEGQGPGQEIHGDGRSRGQKDQPKCEIMNYKYIFLKNNLKSHQVVQLKCLFSGAVPARAVKDPLNGTLAFERTVCYYKNMDLQKLCR